MRPNIDRPNYILAGLDAQQLDAVTTTDMPLVILAGAGSGKTTVLTKRIAYQHHRHEISADRSLVLTFTRKAALELRERLFALGIRSNIGVGTFHSIALSELIKYRRSHQRPDLKILDNQAQLLGEVIESMKLPYSTLKFLNDNLTYLSSNYHLAKVNSQDEITRKELEQYNRLNLDAELLWNIFSAYESKRQKRYLVEIDDIIPTLVAFLKKDWKATENIRFRFKHIFVDEFQDINTQQYAFLKFILNNRDSFCAVGDSNQSIYQFNGSNPDLIYKLIKDKKTNVIHLTNNYRSNSQIANNSLNFLNQFVDEKLSATSQFEAISNSTHILHTADDLDEMHTVLALIKSKHNNGTNYSDIAVLARTNNLIDALRSFLEGKNVPVNHKPIPLGLKLLISKNVNDYDSNIPIKSLIVDTDEVIREGNSSKQTLEKLNTVLNLAQMAISIDKEMNYEQFLRWVKLETLQQKESKDGITLGTFHSVKGLEFDTVILIGVEDKLVPFYRSSFKRKESEPGLSKSLKEEINLFYVAITRAKSELFITWAKNRMINSKLEKRKISPFLKDFNTTDPTEPFQNSADKIGYLKNVLRDQKPEPGISDLDKTKAYMLNKFRLLLAESVDVSYRKILSDAEIALLIKSAPTSLKAIQSMIKYPLKQEDIKYIKTILQTKASSKVTPLFH